VVGAGSPALSSSPTISVIVWSAGQLPSVGNRGLEGVITQGERRAAVLRLLQERQQLGADSLPQTLRPELSTTSPSWRVNARRFTVPRWNVPRQHYPGVHAASTLCG